MICVITGTGATPCHPSCKRNDRPVAGGLERHSADAEHPSSGADVEAPVAVAQGRLRRLRRGAGGGAPRARGAPDRARARESWMRSTRSEVGPRADRADRVDGHALALGHAGVGRALLGGGAARRRAAPAAPRDARRSPRARGGARARRRRPRRGTARRCRRPGRAAPRRTAARRRAARARSRRSGRSCRRGRASGGCWSGRAGARRRRPSAVRRRPPCACPSWPSQPPFAIRSSARWRSVTKRVRRFWSTREMSEMWIPFSSRPPSRTIVPTARRGPPSSSIVQLDLHGGPDQQAERVLDQHARHGQVERGRLGGLALLALRRREAGGHDAPGRGPCRGAG